MMGECGGYVWGGWTYRGWRDEGVRAKRRDASLLLSSFDDAFVMTDRGAVLVCLFVPRPEA